MKNILLIFALSICSCSQEDTSPKPCTCDVMVLSDALPVQFWLNECETYNEHEPEGVHYVCWCQPWNCDDTFPIQFTETSDTEFKLLVLSEDSVILGQFDFEKSSIGGGIWVYTYNFSFSDVSPDVCSQRIQLKIVQTGSSFSYTEGGSLSGWTNNDSSVNPPWRIDPFMVRSAKFVSGQITPSVPSGRVINISVVVDGYFEELIVVLSKTSGSGTQEVIFDSFNDPPQSLPATLTETVTADDTYDQCEIYARLTLSSFDLNINSIAISESYEIDNPSFEGSMTPWTNIDNGGGAAWSYSTDKLTTTTFSSSFPNDVTDYAQGNLLSTIPNGTTFDVVLVVKAAAGAFIDWRCDFWQGAITQLYGGIDPDSPVGTGSTQTITIPVTSTSSDATRIRIFALYTSGTVGQVELHSVSIAGQSYTIPNSSFASSSDWVNDNTGTDWVINAGSAELNWPADDIIVSFYEGTTSTSNHARKSVSFPSGTQVAYEFDYFIRNRSSSSSVETIVTVQLRKAGVVISEAEHTVSVANGVGGNQTGSFEGILVTDDSVDQFVIIAERTGIEQTYDFGFASIIVNGDSVIAKSDCLDVQEDHDETILITYSNNRNFDGLIYENQSPDISFNIRVPARFYHEREPEEDNAMELTSSVITTSSEVKTQRLLEVKHGPYYWHKKLRRVLKHQNLTIYDKAWKKEEAYEVIEGKKTWPLKSATCYLTEKNSVVRNVL